MEGAAGVGGEEELGASLLQLEALDQARIEDLITANLGSCLQILPEEDLALALHNFVEKEDKVGGGLEMEGGMAAQLCGGGQGGRGGGRWRGAGLHNFVEEDKVGGGQRCTTAYTPVSTTSCPGAVHLPVLPALGLSGCSTCYQGCSTSYVSGPAILPTIVAHLTCICFCRPVPPDCPVGGCE